jgi:hypothetical protein
MPELRGESQAAANVLTSMPKPSRVIEGLVVGWSCVVVMIAMPNTRIAGVVGVLLFGTWVYLRTGQGLGVRADPDAGLGTNFAKPAVLLCFVAAAAGICDAVWIHRALADPPPVLDGVLLYAALPATAVALLARLAGASAGRWAVLYLAFMALGAVGWTVYWIGSCGDQCR